MQAKATIVAAGILAVGLGAASLGAQYASPSPAATTMEAGVASLTAKLIDPEAKARKQAAAVEAMVKGLTLVDPGMVNEKPMKNQGHLHYQVDDGPIIATTATKLSFHGLKSGSHTITVMLAANDHSPLGPQQKLTVAIP
jgi:hypothetical protein